VRNSDDDDDDDNNNNSDVLTNPISGKCVDYDRKL
jgi:hypothetical protein